jgi:heme exporter protein B
VVFILPIILTLPCSAVLYHLSGQTIWAELLTVLLVVPILFLLGSLFSALTLSVKNPGVLLSLLSFPLYIPVLIFSIQAIEYFRIEEIYAVDFAILGIFFILANLLIPFILKGILKMGFCA